MSATIWQGAVAGLAGVGPQVTFTLDPATGVITQAGSSGRVQFTPAPGYADLSGQFFSGVTFDPASPPADPAAAWAAAEPLLVILDPAKTYTMTITEI